MQADSGQLYYAGISDGNFVSFLFCLQLRQTLEEFFFKLMT